MTLASLPHHVCSLLTHTLPTCASYLCHVSNRQPRCTKHLYKLCIWLHLNSSSGLYPSPLWWGHYTSWHTIFLPVPTLSVPVPWKSWVFSLWLLYLKHSIIPALYQQVLPTLQKSTGLSGSAHCLPSDLQGPRLHSLRSGVAFTVISSTPAKGFRNLKFVLKTKKPPGVLTRECLESALPFLSQSVLTASDEELQ